MTTLSIFNSNGKRYSNSAATATYNIGWVMSRGWGIMAKDIMKIIQPLNPGKQGQSKHAAVECTKRALRVLRVLTLTPLNLSLGGIGSLMRATVNASCTGVRKHF